MAGLSGCPRHQLRPRTHTWYLDGSMLDGQWVDYRAVGFAIVVVTASRDLATIGVHHKVTDANDSLPSRQFTRLSGG